MLLDGSSLIFRAFYGVPASVRSPDGRQVNAVRGFFETLTRLLLTRQPLHVALAADDDWRPDWRVELIPSYKAHRVAEPVPPLLEPQMPIVDEFLDAIGIDRAGHAGYEAEDVVSTWTELARPATVDVVSGDRDLFALIEDPRVRVLYPEKGGLAEVDEAEVTRRYGVPGRRYPDFAVLRGDPSDGLPGLRGVGAVSAATMVAKHGGIDGILADGRLTAEQRDYVLRAWRVVRPVTEVPVPLPAGRRDRYPADPSALAALVAANGHGNTFDRVVAAANQVLAGA